MLQHNLISLKMSSEAKDIGARGATSLERQSRERNFPDIFKELIFMIIASVQYHENARNVQVTLHRCCQDSRFWYSLAVVLLYRAPVLEQKMVSEAFI